MARTLNQYSESEKSFKGMFLYTLIARVSEILMVQLVESDAPRCCSCGADKGVIGFAYHHDPIQLREMIIDICKSIEMEAITKSSAFEIFYGMVIGATLITMGSENCDNDCPNKDKWGDIYGA